jgi:DNA polymerase elongation subunit (family B)
MLNKIPLGKILFLDIETVPQSPAFNSLPENFKTLWEHKAKSLVKEEETAADVYGRAGIYAEFGKIVCISVGYFVQKETLRFRVKSFAGDNEKTILEDFFALLNRYFGTDQHFLCAHNGKEFDFPYIARRGLINGLEIPAPLDNAGKKPWEINHLDTMELWKFGDYKHYTSLALLTAIFDIPSPKDDISGSDVARVYYEEKNIERISKYCEKDVLAVAQLLLKYKGMPILKDEEVDFT